MNIIYVTTYHVHDQITFESSNMGLFFMNSFLKKIKCNLLLFLSQIHHLVYPLVVVRCMTRRHTISTGYWVSTEASWAMAQLSDTMKSPGCHSWAYHRESFLAMMARSSSSSKSMVSFLVVYRSSGVPWSYTNPAIIPRWKHMVTSPLTG